MVLAGRDGCASSIWLWLLTCLVKGSGDGGLRAAYTVGFNTLLQLLAGFTLITALVVRCITAQGAVDVVKTTGLLFAAVDQG